PGRATSADQRAQPFTAPSPTLMIRRWKMKNRTATGIVMIAAAASFNGYWLPWLSAPEDSWATPLVRVKSSGLCEATMKWDSSFHEAWKDRMMMVMTAGSAIGRTIDQKIRNVPAPSMRAASSTLAGMP